MMKLVIKWREKHATLSRLESEEVTVMRAETWQKNM